MTAAVPIDRRAAVGALVASGLLWGLTVPLSKASLAWLDGAWLTFVRFAVAAAALALVTRVRGRRHSPAPAARRALSPAVLAAGALGYGAVILFQNAGIARTSVSHAALIVGAVPALVAIIAVVSGRGTTTRRAWTGYGVALLGIALVAGAGDGSATPAGDALVLVSAVLSAIFVVLQPGLLAGRDPLRVTAAQMAAGALTAVPLAALSGLPDVPQGAGAPLAVAGLAIAGTLLPMALFAVAQTAVPAAVAGAFLNLEPVVGALVGAVAFHEVLGPGQVGGGVLVVAGLMLSALPSRPRTGVAGETLKRVGHHDADGLGASHGKRPGAGRDHAGVGRAGHQPVPDRRLAALLGGRLRRRRLGGGGGPRRGGPAHRRRLAAGAASRG